ncbi:MAG: DNA polymerase II large subunit [Nanoarchaeota archaeon]|nr:DNA polymerase II large subunit [Nanoarchaeota archaeon]
MNTQKYFKELDLDVKKVYDMAEVARAKGLDPVSKVEVPLAKTMAEKVVKLIATVYPQIDNPAVSNRILELEKEHGKLDNAVAFKIAEEVAKQKYCKFSNILEAIEAGVRIGFAYITLGVVSSPIEGFTKLKIAKTRDGKEYFVAYFSGPIRSAGTTASCMVLILINHLRELFGYAKYDPTANEIKRVATELEDFHGRITNLQYMPTEEEALFLAEHMPIQVNGEPSEKIEVSNYKNLERVETNYLRSGFCLIMAEGLAQKAKKGLRLLNKLKSNGISSKDFDFLEDYVKIHEKRDFGKVDASPTYINDLVAGRPVFGHPSKSGGFRFRYGRGRVSGFSAVSLHPATMGITDNFIAIGTQLKIEKPTKGCVTTVCDSIDGPIVKLVNGSVKKVQTLEEARKLYPDVEEIIYIGDILFPFSDVANRNSKLIKPGYVEEWWNLNLKQKGGQVEDCFNVGFEKSIELSEQYKIPFYPKYIFYWTQISAEQFSNLIKWLKNSHFEEKIILPYDKESQEKFEQGKRALELLGVEHEVTIENVLLTPENSKVFLSNFGIFVKEKISLKKKFLEIENKINFEKSVLENINCFSKIKIKDKAGEFIGARMGRPEKAKLRKLVGSPNVLFPVGNEGGRLRSVQAACNVGCVRSSFPIYFCEKCQKETIYPACEDCQEKTKQMFYFPETKEKSFSKTKVGSEVKGFACYTREVNIKHYFEKAVEKLGLPREKIPVLIKGVRGTVSSEHKMEHLCKGILRASFDLQVNKDGTIRFDATELPIVSFKPKEISVGVEKLRELGYDKDIYGKELVDENQILELMPHDVFLPSASETSDEKADNVFFKICNYIDELLVKFYGLKPFYNIKKREDLVGQLGVCMAPHNCAGVICRFIGFSDSLGLYASPYMHAAIRRDCDGDEAAIMLLGDVLLNFSKEFLPSHRGGTQDAPLVLNSKINAGEVDDQILDFEISNEYPLELYELAEQGKHSSEVKIKDVACALRLNEDPFVGLGFTHNTDNFNSGVICSSYKSLGTMQEKVKHQMELVERLRSADTSDTARLIIDKHFLRDMRGNLRKFSTQTFRCVACNEIMRRLPLSGVCPKCSGKVIFTVNEGGVKKYLDAALNLAKKYNLSDYMQQNLELTKRYIDAVFGKDLEKQEKLGGWI